MKSLPNRGGAAAAFATVIVCLPMSSWAQSPHALQTFRTVDYFWSQNPQEFQALWSKARSRTVRLAMLGDSQETSPTSEGSVFIPRLNFEMWQRFGNAPETPVEGCSTYGSGTIPADWLTRGVCSTAGPQPTRVPPLQILPDVTPAAISTLNAAANVTHGSYGQLTMLQPDAIDVNPGAAISNRVNYFDSSGVIKARIFAATNSSSGEIGYLVMPTASNVPSFTVPATASATLDPGLQSAAFAIKSADTGPLDFAGNPYMQLEVFGSDDTKLTDIVGVRFYNETHPEGVVIDTFSHGGYEATSLITRNGNAGAMFRAFGFDAAVIHYGANDAAGDVTAAQFQKNVAAVIALLRSWTGNPAFPVILVADVYRQGLTAAQSDEFDEYVGADLAIAQADHDVMVVNARRLMDSVGWNSTSGDSGEFLGSDGIHYSVQGAQVLAAAEAAAMMNEIRLTTCANDPADLNLPAGATLEISVGGAVPCREYGQLSVAKSLSLNQALLDVELTKDFMPASGQKFKLVSWGSLSGTFGSIQLPALASGLVWDTGALYTSGTIGVAMLVVPKIRVTAEATQSVTAPTSPTPIAFVISGTGALTVTAQSSNATLLPGSAIAISPGCGASRLSCTATPTVATGRTGAATITLTVTDTYGQKSMTNAAIQVNAGTSATNPGAAGGATHGSSSSGSGSSRSQGGGGGSIDLLLLLYLAGVAALSRFPRWFALPARHVSRAWPGRRARSLLVQARCSGVTSITNCPTAPRHARCARLGAARCAL